MATHQFDNLVRTVLASSTSSSWNLAVREWDVIEVEEDPAGQGVCVCGQTGLVKLFTIANQRNGKLLHPIGSVCVNQFGREDLSKRVTLFADLHKLKVTIASGERITLTTKHFSRAILEDLFEQGAFPPDRWNEGDGERDLDFLLKMFNKHDKSSITVKQRKMITALLLSKVVPFVAADPRLK